LDFGHRVTDVWKPKDPVTDDSSI